MTMVGEINIGEDLEERKKEPIEVEKEEDKVEESLKEESSKDEKHSEEVELDTPKEDIKIEIKEDEEENSREIKQAKRISKSEIKYIAIVAAAIIIIFMFTLGDWSFGETQAPGELPVDRLHEMNKEGDLDPERGYMYKGYSFVWEDGLWWTEFYAMETLFKTPLHFGPRDLGEVEITGELAPEFNAVEDVQIAIDPDVRDKFYTLALSELSLNLAKIMNRAPIGSCTKEAVACEGRPIVSCDDDEGLPTIELVLSNSTYSSVELNGTCIKISGNDYGLSKAVDRLLYRWYGIMD